MTTRNTDGFEIPESLSGAVTAYCEAVRGRAEGELSEMSPTWQTYYRLLKKCYRNELIAAVFEGRNADLSSDDNEFTRFVAEEIRKHQSGEGSDLFEKETPSAE